MGLDAGHVDGQILPIPVIPQDYFRVDRIITRNATRWCKLLKPVHGFNLTLMWGRVFHKLFNRLVENPTSGSTVSLLSLAKRPS
jgi:hypothetical protein